MALRITLLQVIRVSDAADTPPVVSGANLFEKYRVAPGAFDEMQSVPGAVRPHWEKLTRALNRLGREELAARWENGRRIIREHGVTYNVYGDPQGMDRPWELDMIPLVISEEEWRHIEAGLIQRARLLNLILDDIYAGSQRLLRDGFLPPALVYANPAFLRPCRGIRPPKDLYLHLYAADLARSPDGKWWVLSDRTQAPSGTGYALENRVVLSRILPDEIRDCHVQRLAPFVRLQRDTLRSIAPTSDDNPNVVLLTPGTYNETYFEHAYLARFLGIPLVEGADLTVRDRRVFIKTLEGLQQVDVILRRVDDTFCDPLELRGDSFLGVPGLVEATRAGHVTVTNALGAGLIESPVFLAFLPWLCRHLLGEDLILPSVATWWCGQGKEQEYVIQNLDKLVIKPALGTMRAKPIFSRNLSAGDRARLVDAIRISPHEYIGQEQVLLSNAPVWAGDHPEARPVVLRSFVAAGGDSFAVMPGGLTRVSTLAEGPIVTMQSGGGSKDTWVMGDRPAGHVGLQALASEVRHSGGTLVGVPSRTADNLFWLGRYTERLEQTLRVLRCMVGRLADDSGNGGSADIAGLAQIMVGLDLLPIRFQARVPQSELQQQVLKLVYDQDLIGSVRELLGRIRFIVSVVRDRFSGDTWRILNRLQLDARSRPGRLPLINALAIIHNLVLDLAAFSGMEMENMTRGHGWLFLDFGRRLERGSSVANLLCAGIASQAQGDPTLESMLEIADSIMTYRRRYLAEPRLGGVLELLLKDETNPRSVMFQLNALAEHAGNLPVGSVSAQVGEEKESVARMIAVLQAADLPHLAEQGEAGSSEALQKLLMEIGTGLSKLSDQITHHYFSHTVPKIS